MDALSSLKMMASPEVGAHLSDLAKSVTPQAIPAQDLQQLNSDLPAEAVSATQPTGSFSNLLSDFVGEVNSQQSAAGDALTGLLSGKNVSLHQAMISMEEASVSFQMMVEVRNKLLDSYQELMRMQV
jgi:flagellar hook-basal body complex protein FliE